MEAAKNLDWFQDEVKNKQVLSSGKRIGTLTEIKPRLRPSYYKEKGEKPALTFVFVVHRQQDELLDSYVSRTVTSSRSDRSSCMTLIKELSGTNPPSPEIIADKSKLKAFLTGLIGKQYYLQIEPSKCGRFNNLIKAEAV